MRKCFVCEKEFDDSVRECPVDAVLLPDSDQLIGTTFIPDYEILSFIGQGGICRVYRAVHLQMERTVAVKVLKKEWLGDVEMVRRFAQESRLLSTLDHENIAKIYSVGLSTDGRPYLVLEFVEGISLEDAMVRGLSGANVLDIFKQVASALKHAHDNKIIHRDIKPSNILITQCGNGLQVSKIIDFGLSRSTVKTANRDQKLTKTGMLVGTEGYIAPEVWLGEGATERSDIYSFGKTILACTEYVRDLPEVLSAVASRATNAHPQDRFADFDEVVETLAAVPKKRTVSAIHQLVIAFSVAGFVIAAAMAAWFFFQSAINQQIERKIEEACLLMHFDPITFQQRLYDGVSMPVVMGVERDSAGKISKQAVELADRFSPGSGVASDAHFLNAAIMRASNLATPKQINSEYARAASLALRVPESRRTVWLLIDYASSLFDLHNFEQEQPVIEKAVRLSLQRHWLHEWQVSTQQLWHCLYEQHKCEDLLKAVQTSLPVEEVQNWDLTGAMHPAEWQARIQLEMGGYYYEGCLHNHKAAANCYKRGLALLAREHDDIGLHCCLMTHLLECMLHSGADTDALAIADEGVHLLRSLRAPLADEMSTVYPFLIYRFSCEDKLDYIEPALADMEQILYLRGGLHLHQQLLVLPEVRALCCKLRTPLQRQRAAACLQSVQESLAAADFVSKDKKFAAQETIESTLAILCYSSPSDLTESASHLRHCVELAAKNEDNNNVTAVVNHVIDSLNYVIGRQLAMGQIKSASEITDAMLSQVQNARETRARQLIEKRLLVIQQTSWWYHSKSAPSTDWEAARQLWLGAHCWERAKQYAKASACYRKGLSLLTNRSGLALHVELLRHCYERAAQAGDVRQALALSKQACALLDSADEGTAEELGDRYSFWSCRIRFEMSLNQIEPALTDLEQLFQRKGFRQQKIDAIPLVSELCWKLSSGSENERLIACANQAGAFLMGDSSMQEDAKRKATEQVQQALLICYANAHDVKMAADALVRFIKSAVRGSGADRDNDLHVIAALQRSAMHEWLRSNFAECIKICQGARSQLAGKDARALRISADLDCALGLTSQMQGSYLDGVGFYERAAEEFGQIPDYSMQAWASLQLAYCQYRSRDSDRASQSLKQAEALYERSDNWPAITVALLTTKAEIECDQGLYEQALHDNKQAAQIALGPNPTLESEAPYLIIDCCTLFHMNRRREAESLLKRVLPALKRSSLAAEYELLALNPAKGCNAQAREFLAKAIALRKSAGELHMMQIDEYELARLR